MKENNRTLGIIGGCGPVATTNIIQTIQDRTPIDVEQQHVPILASIDATLPSRVAAIRGDGEPVESQFVENARALEDMGADYLLIGSNTSHYYHPAVNDAVSVPVLDAPRSTMEWCESRGYDRVLVLGTDVLRSTGIYDTAAADTTVQVEYPDPDRSMEIIYEFKNGNFVRAQELLETQLAEANDPVVLACTELSCLDAGGPTTTIDPIIVIADEIVDRLALDSAPETATSGTVLEQERR